MLGKNKNQKPKIMKNKNENKSKKKKFPDFSNLKHILLITLSFSILFIFLGFITGNHGALGILIIMTVFINIIPIVLSVYKKFRNIQEMEEKFPNLLYDLTESIRSGVPFHQALAITSKNNYGALSPEINKMSNQLSWGIPLDKVLTRFANRMKESKRLSTSIKIIKESFISGGEVTSTLESVAENVNNLQEINKEKKALLSQYVLLMYAISIIFIVIVAAINKFLLPVFQSGQDSEAGLSNLIQLDNPCNNPFGFEENVCWIYNTIYKCLLAPSNQVENICKLKNETETLRNISVYYTSLFFMMSLIQSIFSGLVAGQMSEGNVKAGLKHSIILAGITIGAFLILIQLGFLGI